jgi:hypothetical protein
VLWVQVAFDKEGCDPCKKALESMMARMCSFLDAANLSIARYSLVANELLVLAYIANFAQQ